MALCQKRTFSLPEEQAQYIDRMVASGAYASSSEVTTEHDAAIERWLREEVVPVAGALQGNPAGTLPTDRIFDRVRALHAERRKECGRDA